MSGTANATWLMPTTPRLGPWFWAMDVAAMPTSVPATNRRRPRMSSSLCFEVVCSQIGTLRLARLMSACLSMTRFPREPNRDTFPGTYATGQGARFVRKRIRETSDETPGSLLQHRHDGDAHPTHVCR